MGKLTGKIKSSFRLFTWRECKQCGKKVKPLSSGEYRCPDCGLLDYRKVTKRKWYGFSTIDVFEKDIRVVFLEKAIAQLLDRMDMSWQMKMDRLKGLRMSAWFRVYMDIKREIEQGVDTRFADKILTVQGTSENSLFVAKKLESKALGFKKGARFVKGKQKEITRLTSKLLEGYDLEVELWDGTPILRFCRTLNGEDVEIGIRAPITEYGKSYRVWMRVNGVHMYPAKPVALKSSEAWVLRAYHTRDWKKNLAHLIEHCVGLSNQAVRIVQASRKKFLSVKKAQQLLSPELSEEEKQEILKRWNSGSLWELAEEANRINRSASIFVLETYGILKYKEN